MLLQADKDIEYTVLCAALLAIELHEACGGSGAKDANCAYLLQSLPGMLGTLEWLFSSVLLRP